jgi:RHS repeat-associated protein
MSLRQYIRQQNEQQMFSVACIGDDFWCSSACLELDQTAQIISYEEYHPFGTTSYRSGRTETEVSLKRYKYVGKERDEETGLYYYGARYYAAWICRFVSVDPLQFEYPYYTPYQYAGNKPISYIDLDGLEEAKPKGINPELSEESGDGLQNNNGSKLNGNPYWEEVESSKSNVSIQEDLPEIITYGRIDFRNPAAGDAKLTKYLIQQLEENFNKYSNVEKKQIKKQIKGLNRELKIQEKNAGYVNEAIQRIILANEIGLKNDSEKFGIPLGHVLKPLCDISEWAENKEIDNVYISISIDKIVTTNNKSPLGSTQKVNMINNNSVGFRIKISPMSINKDLTLGNEIGDVYFDTIMEDSEFSKRDSENIVTYSRGHNVTEQEAHDILYLKLNATNFSFKMENLFRKILSNKIFK